MDAAESVKTFLVLILGCVAEDRARQPSPDDEAALTSAPSAPLLDTSAGAQGDTESEHAVPGDTAALLGPTYADVVIEAPGAGALPFRDPQLAVNGVRGAGTTGGSFDVFSLGLQEGVDDVLIVAWSGRRVFDGPGPDLVVFENAFVSGPNAHFMDPVVVSVSPDGASWVDFPHDYLAPDERSYSADPVHWSGFAGIRPVLLHEEDNPVDPFDPEAAGGDAVDLAHLPEGDPVAEAIRADGVLQVRLVSAAVLVNPDTGERFPADPVSNGGDVDGVYGHALAEPVR